MLTDDQKIELLRTYGRYEYTNQNDIDLILLSNIYSFSLGFYETIYFDDDDEEKFVKVVGVFDYTPEDINKCFKMMESINKCNLCDDVYHCYFPNMDLCFSCDILQTVYDMDMTGTYAECKICTYRSKETKHHTCVQCVNKVCETCYDKLETCPFCKRDYE